MDAKVRKKMAALRIRELQQVLDRLGLEKKGRKADLQARIAAYFGEPAANGTVQPPREQYKIDAAAKLIDQVFSAMKGLPYLGPDANAAGGMALGGAGLPAGLVEAAAVGLISMQQAPGGTGAAAANGHATAAAGGAVRCICGSMASRGVMVQCEALECGVWQHCECVHYDAAAGGAFMCEGCRVARADPFWRATNRALAPAAKLVHVPGRPQRPGGAWDELYSHLRRDFQLPHALLDSLRAGSDTQLQACSVLLGDSVSARLHWPRHAELRVNNMQYRPYGRSGSLKLGANARDEPASVGTLCFHGRNALSLSAADNRPFCLVLQLARRRSRAEVMALMAPPETAEQALERVRQQAGGGGGDDELMMGHSVMSLRCPNSGMRIVKPARFKTSGGLVAFDLTTFLDLAERTRKWQCPHSMQAGTVQDLVVDGFVQRVLASLQARPEVMEVEVAPSGEWRAPGESAWRSIVEPAAGAGAVAHIKAEAPAALPSGVDAAGTSAPNGGANGVGVQHGGSDSEGELSEREEMRHAAASVAAAARNRPPEPEPEVIMLSDSDDDVTPPPPPLPPHTAWGPLPGTEAAMAQDGHDWIGDLLANGDADDALGGGAAEQGGGGWASAEGNGGVPMDYRGVIDLDPD
ncbi:hypothetical protein WJX81_005406 [Elliptochloris bilobata]|uniref:SAP domain-containing protein n=1 Tax=Elliptochloris bilobata TaxID=381761 RepID=A0AAW1RN82_9CHLO